MLLLVGQMKRSKISAPNVYVLIATAYVCTLLYAVEVGQIGIDLALFSTFLSVFPCAALTLKFTHKKQINVLTKVPLLIFVGLYTLSKSNNHLLNYVPIFILLITFILIWMNFKNHRPMVRYLSLCLLFAVPEAISFLIMNDIQYFLPISMFSFLVSIVYAQQAGNYFTSYHFIKGKLNEG